jgi:hypothetical protein
MHSHLDLGSLKADAFLQLVVQVLTSLEVVSKAISNRVELLESQFPNIATNCSLEGLPSPE